MNGPVALLGSRLPFRVRQPKAVALMEVGCAPDIHVAGITVERLPSRWQEPTAIAEASFYLQRRYERLVPRLAQALNCVHGVRYDASFWELPMASWLLHFIHTTFDRYTKLQDAQVFYGDSTVFLTSGLRCSPPEHYRRFIDDYCTNDIPVDYYFSLQARAMGIPVEVAEAAAVSNVLAPMSGGGKFTPSQVARGARKELERRIYAFLSPKNKRNGVCFFPYRFEPRDEYLFKKKLGASFFPSYDELHESVILQKRNIEREALLRIPAEDDFEKILITLLPHVMPTYLLEEFESYLVHADKWSGARLFFSAAATYRNIMLCYAISLARLRGAKLAGCQHGGGYGMLDHFHAEFMERRICDFFITWGWSDRHYEGAKLIPLPQPDMSHLENHYRGGADHAVWVGNTSPIYTYRFQGYPLMPSLMARYFSMKHDFAVMLKREIRSSFLYRPYPVDFGWRSEEEALLRDAPEMRMDARGSLHDILKTARLFIADHLGTSLSEALACNTPTIMFWDKAYILERPAASEVFDAFRTAGMLFDNGKDAAAHVNAIWNDIPGWWRAPERQHARKAFIRTYALADKCWQRKWIDAFKEMLADTDERKKQ